MKTGLFRVTLAIAILGTCISAQLPAQTSWTQTDIQMNPDLNPLAVAPDGKLFAGLENILARSTDGGTTWSYLPTPENSGTISSIAIGTDGSIVVCAGRRGIFRSTDDGASWTYTESIESNLGRPVSVMIGRGGAIICLTDVGKVIRSADDGAHWEEIRMLSGSHFPVQDSSGTLFVTAPYQRLSYSTDDGATWTTAGGSHFIPLYAYGDGNLINFSYAGLSTSSDNGFNWSPITLTNGGARDVVAHPSGVLVALTSNGFLRSTDKGATWAPPSSTVPLEPQGGQSSAPGPLLMALPNGDIISGGSSMGMIRSADAGATWSVMPLGLEAFSISSIDRSPANGMLFARASRYREGLQTSSSALLRSTDNGESWQVVYRDSGSELEISSTGHLTLLVNGFMVGSGDNGETWGGGGTIGEQHRVTDILKLPGGGTFAVDHLNNLYYSGPGTGGWQNQGTNPGGTFVAAANGVVMTTGLRRTTDHGKTWTQITAPVPGFVSMVLGSDGTLYGLYDRQVYTSADDGLTWTPLPGNPLLPEAFKSNSTTPIIRVGPDGALFAAAAASEPLYAYNASSGAWESRGTALPHRQRIIDMVILAGSKVVAGTPGLGIYLSTATASVMAPQRSARGLMLSSAQPQPASGITEIRFALPHAAQTHISLYDMSGRRIATLLDEPREAGQGSVGFNADALPSGIYLCRLTAAGEEARTMVVVAH